MYAYITAGGNGNSDLAPLRIGKGKVSFFIKPLKNYCHFSQHPQNPDTWYLTFFNQTEFAIDLTVRVMKEPMPKDEALANRVLAKAVWFNNEFQSSNNEKFAEDMSQFLRGSSALTMDKLIPTTHGHHLVTDRNGLAYLSGNADQFKRIVLCLSLAVAYSQILRRCEERLTFALKRREYDSLPELYENILFFNASDYFSHPVSLDRHELFAVWKLIRDHWHIDEINEELTEQLAGVSSLLKEHREQEAAKFRLEAAERKRNAEKAADERRMIAEKKEQRKDRKFNVTIGIASLVVGIFSIISLVEITPTHFKQAYQNWVTPVIENMSDSE
ncbi:hypothetical protein [Halomonas piscis]|uniref:hypothetical protein n=1 Tax=Halomonas piscis TaxID=3031727 RepID=UPI00289A0845|nr:hypothetical protein [Halomonas piscis]